MWVASDPIIVVPDNKASVTDIIDTVTPSWLQDTTADFSTVPAGTYLWTTDVAGTTTYSGPFYVTGGDVAGMLYFRTFAPGQRLPVAGEYWRLRRGAHVEIAAVQIRPVARTVL